MFEWAARAARAAWRAPDHNYTSSCQISLNFIYDAEAYPFSIKDLDAFVDIIYLKTIKKKFTWVTQKSRL